MTDSSSPAADVISYFPFPSEEGLEDVQLYNEGGFHPVNIGDLLDARFEVIHKLGHGGFGVVWLCLDIVYNKWRAVKILAADRSVKGGDAETMSYLMSQASLKELEDNHIALTLETFWIDGPNGRHFCSVMEVLGSTVADWCGELDPLAPNNAANVKDVCRQIAKGVQFLHKHDICHGDLRAPNVLMRLKGIDQLNRSQLLELIGEPECYDVEVVDGLDSRGHAPKYCVLPLYDNFKSLYTGTVAIIDFGESFHVDTPPRGTGIPISYSAPENLLNVAVGFGNDIWSLACTIYDLRAQGSIFSRFHGFNRLQIFEVIRSWEYYLGPLPEPYRTAYDQHRNKSSKEIPKYCLDESIEATTEAQETPQEQLKPVGWSTESLLEAKEKALTKSEYLDVLEADIGGERNTLVPHPEKPINYVTYRYSRYEVAELADLLKQMWQFDLVRRIDIDEVLRHPWLHDPSDVYPPTTPATPTIPNIPDRPGTFWENEIPLGAVALWTFALLMLITPIQSWLRGQDSPAELSYCLIEPFGTRC